MGGADDGGLFQCVKGHREMTYRMLSHQTEVEKSATQIKTVVLCKASLRADLKQSQSTVGGGIPQLTSQ